jgi:hypothetical protein
VTSVTWSGVRCLNKSQISFKMQVHRDENRVKVVRHGLCTGGEQVVEVRRETLNICGY